MFTGDLGVPQSAFGGHLLYPQLVGLKVFYLPHAPPVDNPLRGAAVNQHLSIKM